MSETALEARLENAVERAGRLPNLATAVHVLELSEDNVAGFSEVAKFIASAPVLSAGLMRTANSPLFASRRKIENLRQALSLLGINAAVTLALSLSLMAHDPGESIDGKRFWRRALVSALVARALAVQLHVHEPEVFFQAAVLQDIGQLVLEKSDPRLYADILRRARSHQALVTEETNVLGFDHAQVGAHLLKRWGISEKLCQAVRCSHHAQPQRDDGLGQLDNCVYLSRSLAEFWLSVDGGKVDIRAVAHETEALLGLTPDDFHQTQARIAEWIPQYADMFDVRLNTPGILAALLQRSDECELLPAPSVEPAEPAPPPRPPKPPKPVVHPHPGPAGPPNLLDERHLLAIVKHEFEAARLGGWPLSVCRLTLDSLKEVRARLGEEAGEKLQWDTAQHVRNRLRPTDFVASSTKNGITLVLPGTSDDNADVVIERLRVVSPGQAERPEFSIGVVTYLKDSPGSCGIDSVRDLLAAVDRANYVARIVGGNRTFRYRCV